ncbi:BamA/TamA family outer membrane protein [Fulvivirgaceae bacterium BMA10]|uniref:BamA/TamA family outer membrane protein n=1 Tax=Splendidivirga corallicola TaxID=3051826 RepID=A0ABT8KJG1_9BACT|nr:BamA/TamA family outer membrane protein [Fulvivirgaceae bacterium BMA10]
MKRVTKTLFLLSTVLLSGCLGTRYLKDGEDLLYKQEIKGTEGLNKEDLYALYRQKPNNRFPFPYYWFYQVGLRKYDTAKIRQKKQRIEYYFLNKIRKARDNERRVKNLNSKKLAKLAVQDRVLEEGNLFMRWGEPLAVYDSLKTEETVSQLNQYLHSKGYFQAVSSYDVKKSGRKISLTYQLTPGTPHRLDSIYYSTQDSAIYKLIQANVKEAILQKGQNYDQRKFSRERDRIDALLKNNGYFGFNKQYIYFNVDTTSGDYGIDTNIVIETPPGEDKHKVFKVDTIKFRTDANIVVPNAKRSTNMYQGIVYEYYKRKFSRRVLNRRVFIKQGDYYSRDNTFKTQRQLANLDMFRFVNINYDTTGGKMIANIVTSPLKKFQTSNEVGINVASQGLPGPFYNVSFKNRNIFGGLETLEFNGRVSIEGVPSGTDVNEVLKSQELSGNFTLTFPQFIFPYGNKLTSRAGLFNPKTRIAVGDIYTNRPDYRRNNLNGSISYSWSNQKNAQFIFTLDEISLINTGNISNAFQDRLDQLEMQGSNLFRSFEPSFVSSMSLLNIYNFNSYGSQNSRAAFLKLFLESGGTTLNFINTDFLEARNLEFYKFLKFNIDYRQLLPISGANTLAYRVNVGIAKSYSDNKVLPYEKYFFAGGSNGIRAWSPRRLGPGAFTPINETTGLFDDRFEQYGEILLESSLELRRNLFGFLDGALFIDAGNIWTIDEEEGRENGKFRIDKFFKEIAVGSGAGLRFDFSFLILRFDAAIKIHDPARPEGSRFIFNKDFNSDVFRNQNLVNYNIGIGYPF